MAASAPPAERLLSDKVMNFAQNEPTKSSLTAQSGVQRSAAATPGTAGRTLGYAYGSTLAEGPADINGDHQRKCSSCGKWKVVCNSRALTSSSRALTASYHALTSSSHALTTSSHALTASSHTLTTSSHALLTVPVAASEKCCLYTHLISFYSVSHAHSICLPDFV